MSNSASTPDKITVTGEGKFSTGIEGPSAAVAGFTLGQNFPNPVVSATAIPFELHRAGKVTLRVENMIGQTLALLVDEDRATGSYSASWDASATPAGMYRFVLSVNGIQASGRMLVVR
ncbi:MAG: hypothetical protein IPP94_14820 [Ignavibacteria bacterium]|nr:hypothetical protein [Ignavibacteria bacterium]